MPNLQKSTVIRHGAFGQIPNELRAVINAEIADGTKGRAIPATGMDGTPTFMNELFVIAEANLENHDNILQDHENRLTNIESYESAAVEGVTIDSTEFASVDERLNVVQSATRAVRTEVDNTHTYAAGNALAISSTTFDKANIRLDTIQKAVIDEITTNRGAAISSAIGTEETNRNTAISTAVSGEATARDTAISTAIGTEVTNRNDAIDTAVSSQTTAFNVLYNDTNTVMADTFATINAAVGTEATTRGDADTALQSQIDNLPANNIQLLEPMYNGGLRDTYESGGNIIARGWTINPPTQLSNPGGFYGDTNVTLHPGQYVLSPLIPVSPIAKRRLLSFVAAGDSPIVLTVTYQYYAADGTTKLGAETQILGNSLATLGATLGNPKYFVLQIPSGVGTARFIQIKATASSTGALAIGEFGWDKPLPNLGFYYFNATGLNISTSGPSNAYTVLYTDYPFVTNLEFTAIMCASYQAASGVGTIVLHSTQNGSPIPINGVGGGSPVPISLLARGGGNVDYRAIFQPMIYWTSGTIILSTQSNWFIKCDFI